MKSELIVDVTASDVTIALLEDGRLVNLQKESRDIEYAVGDIYLAKVKKLMPGLNAAFVNVGYEKDAFLHYLDLGPNFNSYLQYVNALVSDKKRLPSMAKMKLQPEIDKHGSVTGTLEPGQELLVQIVKEPISSKGPRLTTELTFTGRYLVLTPFSDKVSISQKIKSPQEKQRLRQLIESIKPKNFGVIIRTSAEGKRVAELNNELKTLLECFESACLKAQRSVAPALVFEEQNRAVGMLRDVFSPSFEAIHVNDAAIHAEILKYVALIAPERRDIVKHYTAAEPIFDHFSVTRQIKSSFGKTVSFKSGAYIIIEHTEALHVIDVNSGNRSKAANDQESNALEVNLRAADEIARQLRLRDMGGIIVVDFIDMAKSEHRQQLYEHMKEIMANDRARHNILPLSKFGLMQITRQRVRPAMDLVVTESCPSCHGTGHVQPSILFTDTLFEKLDYVVNTLRVKDFVMYIHPYVDAYIKKGLIFNTYRSWRSKLGRTFKILPDQSLGYLEYKVLDSARNEINLREEKDLNRPSAEKAGKKEQRGNEPEETSKAEQPKAEPAKPKKEAKAKPEAPKKESAPRKEASPKKETEPQKAAAAKKEVAPKAEKPKKEQAPKAAPVQAPKEETAPEAPKSELQAAEPKKEPKPKRPKSKIRAVDARKVQAILLGSAGDENRPARRRRRRKPRPAEAAAPAASQE